MQPAGTREGTWRRFSWDENKAGILRVASLALPLLGTSLAWVFCWRQGFSGRSVAVAAMMIAWAIYHGIFFALRARGSDAYFFYFWIDARDPDNYDEYDKDNVDITSFWTAAGYLGFVAFMVFKAW